MEALNAQGKPRKNSGRHAGREGGRPVPGSPCWGWTGLDSVSVVWLMVWSFRADALVPPLYFILGRQSHDRYDNSRKYIRTSTVVWTRAQISFKPPRVMQLLVRDDEKQTTENRKIKIQDTKYKHSVWEFIMALCKKTRMHIMLDAWHITRNSNGWSIQQQQQQSASTSRLCLLPRWALLLQQCSSTHVFSH